MNEETGDELYLTPLHRLFIDPQGDDKTLTERVTELVWANAALNAVSAGGHTPLDYAIAAHGENAPCVAVLRALGACRGTELRRYRWWYNARLWFAAKPTERTRRLAGAVICRCPIATAWWHREALVFENSGEGDPLVVMQQLADVLNTLSEVLPTAGITFFRETLGPHDCRTDRTEEDAQWSASLFRYDRKETFKGAKQTIVFQDTDKFGFAGPIRLIIDKTSTQAGSPHAPVTVEEINLYLTKLTYALVVQRVCFEPGHPLLLHHKGKPLRITCARYGKNGFVFSAYPLRDAVL